MKINYKLLILGLLGVVVILLGFGVVRNYSQTTKVEFSFSDIDEVTIFQRDSEGNLSEITTINETGSNIRLTKFKEYSVEYKAQSGFADGSLNFETEDEPKKVSITPYYSDEKLDEILKTELTTIQDVIKSTYGDPVNSYDILPGNLYHRGEWYGTTMIYKGTDPFVSDPVRVVLEKKNGVWVASVPSPQLNLNIYTNPEIPRDVLDYTNIYNAAPSQ